MSTALKTLKSITEKSRPESEKPKYHESELNLTRFWGGENRGKSLEIGFYNESNEYQIVQIDAENVKLLIKELVENFV